MMKSMLALFFIALPLTAIRLPPAKTSKVSKTSAAALDSAESVMRKAAKGKNHAWISFVGDSNMRNTYWWWVTSKLNQTGVKLIRSKQFTYNAGESLADLLKTPHENSQWSDQEAVLEFPDGFEVRTSFRFLHGGDKEFQLKTKEWNKVLFSYSMDPDTMDKEMGKVMTLITKEKEESMDDPDAIKPSKKAMEMTSYSKFINFDKDVPALGRKLKVYQNSKPDVVILTEGWGGIPGCERFDEVLDVFKENPEVKFVWAPVYMTNRLKKREQCFSQKIASVPQEKKRNFQYVDMWDLAEKFPMDKVARGHDQTKHMPMGGDYMSTAVQRFEGAIDNLAK
eukprot:gnl/MRDRNA2_/MRDRNA2_83785_c0_seq1.p1 gnl/MRDRNA2_/MRDRNA2_83785_c0~~gnl/MRDRNA2_/MRDRNA2_83785_c0_seq1.p1  ORF type:complete len:338 (+),score=87.32 gnl/MRDRNA2_/MRDRNA2_83785_c0_seq1:64-1077(+)